MFATDVNDAAIKLIEEVNKLSDYEGSAQTLTPELLIAIKQASQNLARFVTWPNKIYIPTPDESEHLESHAKLVRELLLKEIVEWLESFRTTESCCAPGIRKRYGLPPRKDKPTVIAMVMSSSDWTEMQRRIG